MPTSVDVRENFQLDLPNDLACVGCSKVLVSPCTDKLGRLICKSCFKVHGEGQPMRVPEMVLRQLNSLVLRCIHCSLEVENSHARIHLQRECEGFTRTVEQEVEMGSFDLVARVSADLGVVDPKVLLLVSDDGRAEFRALREVLWGQTAHEVGIAFSEGVYATNYGRLVFLANGMLTCSWTANHTPLPVKVQWIIQRMRLGVYVGRMDAFIHNVSTMVVSDQVSVARPIV